MVHDEYKKWHPAAHLLCDHQDHSIVVAFLCTVKDWCSWRPRYFLTDDSAAEQLAVKKAFPCSDDIGVIEVDHLLCRVYSMRIIDRALKAKKYEVVCGHLIAALKY